MPSRPEAPQAPSQKLSTVDALAQLSFAVQAMLDMRAASEDVSMTQTRLLGILRDRTPTMNELAGLLGLDKSSVSGLVDRAERRGLVLRAPSTRDRRVVVVRVTPLGRKVIKHVAEAFAADLMTVLRDLRPIEQRQLAKLASRVLVTHAADRGVELFG